VPHDRGQRQQDRPADGVGTKSNEADMRKWFTDGGHEAKLDPKTQGEDVVEEDGPRPRAGRDRRLHDEPQK
jgi:hypothetical protein